MNTDKMISRAMVALELRKYKLAISLMERVLSQAPYNVLALAITARAYRDLENYDKAIDYTKKALEIDPNQEKILASYAELMMLKGEYDIAFRISDDALAINPNDSYVIFIRVVLFYKTKQYDKAEILTKYLLKIVPNDEGYHRMLGSIYSDKKLFDLAEKEFLTSLQINPNNASTFNQYAISLVEHNKCNSKAENLLKEAVRLEPENKIMQSNFEYVSKRVNKFYYTMIDFKNDYETNKKEDIIICFITLIFLFFISNYEIIYTHSFTTYQKIILIVLCIQLILWLVYIFALYYIKNYNKSPMQ